jgi:hypothetical protein
MPARSAAEIWTNASFPASSGMTPPIENAAQCPSDYDIAQPSVRIERRLGKIIRHMAKTGKLSNETLYSSNGNPSDLNGGSDAIPAKL